MANSYYYELENVIDGLENWGLTDVFLPFLLIFIVIFAILQKTHILGENKKNLNVAVAVIFGLMVVIPHVTNNYPYGLDIVDIMNSALPTVSIVVVAIIMMLILMGIFGADATVLGQKLSGWIAIISVVLIVIIFGGSAGWWGDWSWFNQFFGSDAVALIIILLVFGIIIAFITGGEKNSEAEHGLKNIGKSLESVFSRK